MVVIVVIICANIFLDLAEVLSSLTYSFVLFSLTPGTKIA